MVDERYENKAPAIFLFSGIYVPEIHNQRKTIRRITEMIMLLNAVVAEQFLPYLFLFVGVVAKFCGYVVDGVYAMGFFSSAISSLKTVITAIGAGIGIWGVINLLEGYSSQDPNGKNQGIKQMMAGGGIIIVAQTVVPLLASLFGGGGGEGGEGGE